MSDSELSEIEIIQNPALCSYLIWLYGLAFQKDAEVPSPLLLSFLVLPLLLHKPTLKLISSTYLRSGLPLFAAKFSDAREDLLAVHARAIALRPLTLRSLSVGASTRLLTIDYVNATVRANQLESEVKTARLPERLKALPGAAEKIGRWFSASGPFQVASTLRADF